MCLSVISDLKSFFIRPLSVLLTTSSSERAFVDIALTSTTPSPVTLSKSVYLQNFISVLQESARHYLLLRGILSWTEVWERRIKKTLLVRNNSDYYGKSYNSEHLKALLMSLINFMLWTFFRST